MASPFNGSKWPKISVLAGIGATASNVCVRGTGVRGTNVRGGVNATVDVGADVQSIQIQRGRSSEFDAATPGSAVIVLRNSSGDYDPTNLNSPYAANRFGTETEGLEGGTVGGYVVGGSCTIANSTTQAHSGTHSLALTSTVGSGGIWTNTTTGLGGIDVSANRGLPYKTTLWARSQSHAVSVLVAMLWYDEGGDLVQQDNGSSVATSTSGWAQPTITGTVPGFAAYAAVQALFFNMASIGEVHYVDDLFFITGTKTTIGTPVVVQVEKPLGLPYKRFTGKIADIAMDAGLHPTVTWTCTDGLEDLGRIQLATETPQFAGDTSGQRVNNILDRAAWPATARLVDGGQETLTPTTFGAGALDLLRQVEQTEFGFLFCNVDNNVVFYERHRAETANRSVAVQAKLTDTAGPGELGMMELELALSRERVVNQAAGTRQPDPSQDPDLTGSSPGDVPVEQTASNAASVAAYGTLSLPTEVGTLARSDVAVKGLLQGIVGRFGTPQVRIREVRVNALRGDLWSVLLPLGLLDRIAVLRDYGANTITGELLVQATEEEIQVSPARWELRFTTSNPPPLIHYCVRGEGVRGTDIRGW